MKPVTAPAQSETLPSKKQSFDNRISAFDIELEKQSKKRINAATVRQLCGGISDMTLWRWLHKDDLKFPRPIYIGRRRYWRESEVIDWLDAQETAV